MKQEDVNRCQIQVWYPKFESDTLKSEFIDLPESFVEYLIDENGSFLLPIGIAPTPPSFPELEMKVKESIESLGGAAFPKLNWSSPKDAAWITSTGNLKCTSFSEVALLFKSSDSIIHDLCHAYDSCCNKTMSRPPKFVLALRKWYPSLHPEMEFRCFVKNMVLVGVSQREVTEFYPSLVPNKYELKTAIQSFFCAKVKGKFEAERYTFDIYATRDHGIKLLDFNPWGGYTSPLLFTWEELDEGENEFDFRIVENQFEVRPGLNTAVHPGSGWDEFVMMANEDLYQQGSSRKAGA